MGVLLAPDDIEIWLSSDQDAAAALLQTAPDGTLTVAAADGVDWSGP